MDKLLTDIIAEVKEHGALEPRALDRVIAAHNRRFRDPVKHFAKKQLAGEYLRIKQDDPELWKSWELDSQAERALLSSIQVKPRRTASGVATVTVITKPHPCAGNCVYCPNDVRMPKSYLHNEPACQRAERSFFDPYLQVASRLLALHNMGHATDKVELIVLGGSFTDYPQGYQMWFVRELFRALNDAKGGFDGLSDVFVPQGEAGFASSSPMQEGAPCVPCSIIAENAAARLEEYTSLGISNNAAELEKRAAPWQKLVRTCQASYNDAVRALYGEDESWRQAAAWQTAAMEEVCREQAANEDAAHRNVGLVMETRPDAVSPAALTLLRSLGCTKLQMGVQTLDEQVAALCMRPTPLAQVRSSFELARAFGFKSHAHFMANLPGATPDADKADYASFVNDDAVAPDEVKLYPCALIGSTALERLAEAGQWSPYQQDELVDLLAADVLATPAHCRISRMIRDFSSEDILEGNKTPNLRQVVEERTAHLVKEGATPVQEIRLREIATDYIDAHALQLLEERYETTNTHEVFLQWVVPATKAALQANRIAAFLRLSLPNREWVAAQDGLPLHAGQAMIREVHVYGAAARLHAPTAGAQHRGLGRTLVERACTLAKEAGYERINVISAVGTRNYYRMLGFSDGPLYQFRNL